MLPIGKSKEDASNDVSIENMEFENYLEDFILELSEEDLELLNYLLTSLGFIENNFLKKYCSVLFSSTKYFKNYRGINDPEELYDPDDPDTDNEFINYTTHYFHNNKWIPKDYSILDYFKDEYVLKKINDSTNVSFIKNKDGVTYRCNRIPVFKTTDLEINKKLISATDLSAYSFCPVSFAINRSCEVESNVLADTSTNLHEKNLLTRRLLGKVYDGDLLLDKNRLINTGNRGLFEDIESSQLIYSGHVNKGKRYFVNKKGNYVGQPDYVFKRKDGNTFVVEEKFNLYQPYESLNPKKLFYHNHEVQLNSYIYGLDEFQPEYGYLVYWDYHYNDDDNIKISNCVVKRYNKNEETRQELNTIYSKVKNLKDNKRIDFSPNQLNPIKCAKCVVSRFCGHKIGRFNELEFPYSPKYYKLWPSSYPKLFNEKNTSDSNEENIFDSFYFWILNSNDK